MFKPLFVLPFVAFTLVAAKPAEAPVEQKPSINAPAEIAADPANRLNIELSNGGTVVIQLRPDVAPNHVRRIQELASSGFYNGTIFHRVIPGFMAQGGDPQGTGTGGSPLPDLAAEFNDLPHLRGVLSMARAEDENSANSRERQDGKGRRHGAQTRGRYGSQHEGHLVEGGRDTEGTRQPRGARQMIEHGPQISGGSAVDQSCDCRKHDEPGERRLVCREQAN